MLVIKFRKKLYENCGIDNLILVNQKSKYVVEVINIRIYSCKTNTLRNVLHAP